MGQDDQDEADEGAYDLVDEEPLEAIPLDVVPATPAVPTLGYARAAAPYVPARGRLAHRGRGAAANPFGHVQERWRDFYVPLAVTAMGTLVVYAFALAALRAARFPGIGWAQAFALAAKWVGLNFVFDLAVIFVSLVVGAKLLDVHFGTLQTAAMKVSAVVMGPAILLWPIVWFDNGGCGGVLIGLSLSIAFYLGLLSYLFELDFREVIILAGLSLFVRIIGNVIWIRVFGAWGYGM